MLYSIFNVLLMHNNLIIYFIYYRHTRRRNISTCLLSLTYALSFLVFLLTDIISPPSAVKRWRRGT